MLKGVYGHDAIICARVFNWHHSKKKWAPGEAFHQCPVWRGRHFCCFFFMPFTLKIRGWDKLQSSLFFKFWGQNRKKIWMTKASNLLQCTKTNTNLFKITRSNRWSGQMARESRGNPYCKRDLVIMMTHTHTALIQMLFYCRKSLLSWELFREWKFFRIVACSFLWSWKMFTFTI